MIVMTALDPGELRVYLEDVALPLDFGAQSLDEVQENARSLRVERWSVDAPPAEHCLGNRWAAYDDHLANGMQFPHDRASISAVDLYIRGLLALNSGTSEAALRRVHLALHELSNNALEHGMPLVPNAQFTVELELWPGRIRGCLRDRCLAFNPLDLEPLQVTERIALRARRGYGIHLARQLLDHLEHRYFEGRNELRFEVSLPQAAPIS